MRLFLILGLLFLKTTVYGQFTIGVKIGGIAFHQQPVSPNYYKWSIDKNGRFVGFAGFSITAGYRFNPFIGVKVIQTILPYDCAGKFSGITHIGVDFHDDIMNIICSETYLQNGVLADINDIKENYGWFIVSTIYFETKLTDEIMLWKYNESENKWYEKTINARLLLQLNGT